MFALGPYLSLQTFQYRSLSNLTVSIGDFDFIIFYKIGLIQVDHFSFEQINGKYLCSYIMSISIQSLKYLDNYQNILINLKLITNFILKINLSYVIIVYFAHLSLTARQVNLQFKSSMQNQTVNQLLDIANKVQNQINCKLRRTQPIIRLSHAISEIRGSLQELKELNGEVKWTKPSQPDGVLNFIGEQVSSENAKKRQELKQLKKKIKKQEKPSINEHKQNINSAQNQSQEKSGNGRGPYRQYSIQTKENVLELFRKGLSYSKISKLLKIPSKNIIRWCKNGTRRRAGAGRKVMDPQMESSLNKWIEATFSVKQSVSIQMVRKKAKQLCKFSQFFASHGWFKNFAKRHNLKEKYEFY